MTNYSENPGHVRADLFKPSGKWNHTIMLDMSKYWKSEGTHITAPDAVRAAYYDYMKVNGWHNTFEGTLVVLNPYHQYTHPVMLRLGRDS